MLGGVQRLRVAAEDAGQVQAVRLDQTMGDQVQLG